MASDKTKNILLDFRWGLCRKFLEEVLVSFAVILWLLLFFYVALRRGLGPKCCHGTTEVSKNCRSYNQSCVHCFERSDWADIISFKIIIVHHHKSRAILILFSVKTKMIVYRWWYLTFTCPNPYWLRSLSQVKPEHKEFSMGVASMADSCGIALAGVTALPVHNALCSNWRSRIRWRGCSCAGFQMRVWKNFMENFCIFALLTHLPPPKQCNLTWISIDSFIFTITTFESKYVLFKVKCFRESCVHLLTWERNLYLYLKDSTVF